MTAPSQAARPTRGPLRVNPANPRYFMDADGRTVLLVGSHTWASLQDRGRTDPPPAFDYGKYLDLLSGLGHNFIRLWIWENARWSCETGPDFYFTPLPFARTGPGAALDGKPRFDLTRLDPAFFERLRERVMQAGRRGIYVSVMLFEGWSMGFKGRHRVANPWEGHPLHRDNNVNGIDGDPHGRGHGFDTRLMSDHPALRAARAVQEAYVRRVIEAVNDLDNVSYEISNEDHYDSMDWQRHFIDLIHAEEAARSFQHPVGVCSTFTGDDPGRMTNPVLYDTHADWISPHPRRGEARPYDHMTNPPPADGRKVVIADTDHLWGIGGDRVWAWKSFARGQNPIFMDPYDDPIFGPRMEPKYLILRAALGHIRRLAERMDLAAMTPREDLSSSRYCLACPGREYLIYVPDGGGVTAFLEKGSYRREWFDPETGEAVSGADVAAAPDGNYLAVPFSGDAVLCLKQTPA